MTLQEKAFMLDLIKKNYRRRIIWLVCEFILIIGGITGFILIYLKQIPHPFDTFIIMTNIALIMTGLILIIFHDKPFGLDDLAPAGIKEAQLKALKEHSKDDFEELIHSVPLKEYFEI